MSTLLGLYRISCLSVYLQLEGLLNVLKHKHPGLVISGECAAVRPLTRSRLMGDLEGVQSTARQSVQFIRFIFNYFIYHGLRVQWPIIFSGLAGFLFGACIMEKRKRTHRLLLV